MSFYIKIRTPKNIISERNIKYYKTLERNEEGSEFMSLGTQQEAHAFETEEEATEFKRLHDNGDYCEVVNNYTRN